MHPIDITAALLKQGYTHRSVAAALSVSAPLVSQVIWRRSKSRRVAEHIAQLLGKPVAEVFTDLEEPTPRQRLLAVAA